MSVGDVNSDARGSGARFNDNKPPLELIPLRLIARTLEHSDVSEGHVASEVLATLGFWQEGDDAALNHALYTLDAWDDCARVFDYGKKKYAAWNWAKGMAWSIPMACAARHLRKMAAGEVLDDESGLPHAGHVQCNLVMLATFAQTYPEGDDRPQELRPQTATNFASLTAAQKQLWARSLWDAARQYEPKFDFGQALRSPDSDVRYQNLPCACTGDGS